MGRVPSTQSQFAVPEVIRDDLMELDAQDVALDKLKAEGVVDLDEERKAAMVSNLLVVLCGSKDAQPIVNSGSLY